jgi:hypothetical protein
MKVTKLFNEFFDSEKAGGLTLIACTIISLLIANLLTPYGLRIIFALAYQFCKFVPVFIKIRFQLFYAHGIYSGSPFVAYYLAARFGKVSGTQNVINGLHTFSYFQNSPTFVLLFFFPVALTGGW